MVCGDEGMNRIGCPEQCPARESAAVSACDGCECLRPCPPDAACPECQDFWQRCRDNGLWVDGEGWTSKGVQEFTK